MSAIGSIVGVQEGLEAGSVTGGLAASETHTRLAIGIGLTATAAGVLAGHQVGESALQFMDTYIGDGGVGFMPALAIGASVTWHNMREHTPQQSASRFANSFPYILGAGFAALEGIESGILTSSAQANLLSAEVVTLGVAAATAVAFVGLKLFAKKFSPRNALRIARGVALVPAAYLGAKAIPELAEDPKVGGYVIAALGTTALATAVASFFKKGKSPKTQAIPSV